MPEISDFSAQERDLASKLYSALVKMVEQPHHQVGGIQAGSFGLYIPIEWEGYNYHIEIAPLLKKAESPLISSPND